LFCLLSEERVVENEQKTVIIVDDDVTNLAIGASALSEKFDVLAAPSGEKLFFLLERMTPDIILLDIEMPVMNGYEVIRRLKNSEKTMSIPVIFLTGKPESELKASYLEHGAVGYATKPFSRDRLIELIDFHTSSSSRP